MSAKQTADLPGSFFKKPGFAKPKRRKRLNPVSDKRRKTNVIRRANVEAAFGVNPRCAACGPLLLVGVSQFTTGCHGRADDAHELVSRGRGGSITDVDNIVPVSRQCHDFIGANEELARAAGLALPSQPVRQPLRQVDPRTGEFPRCL